MSQKFEYKIRIPEAVIAPLDLALAEHPSCASDREKYLFLLHLVYRQLRRAYHDARLSGHTPALGTWRCYLHSLYLRNAIGNDYNRIIHNLVGWGFISRGHTYLVGSNGKPGRSKAFWLGRKYVSYWFRYCYTREFRRADNGAPMKKFGRTRAYSIKSRPFLKRLELCASEVKARQLEDVRVGMCHEELRHFSVDRERAGRVLGGMVSRGEMSESRMRKELRKVDKFNAIDKSDTALFVKKDRFGRVHTNVTQLKREVRAECLLCDGKPTAAVDIKSSQGAFLGVILRALVDFHGFYTLDSSPTLIELRKQASIREPDRYRMECERYCGLLSGGGLYEFFARELSADFDIDREVSREEAKHAFFVFLFGPVVFDETADVLRSATRRVWSEHFPRLLCTIEQMKFGNYPALAREMQRIESCFVFERLVPRISLELGCHYCTVHDEVIVPAEFGSEANRIGNDELASMGIPTVTVEEFRMMVPDKDLARHEMDVDMEMYEGPERAIAAAG